MGLTNIFQSENLNKLKRLLKQSERIVVTCHVRPDGDAIGSSLGLYHFLKSIDKDVTVMIPDRAPESLAFLPGYKDMAIFTQHEEYCLRLLNECDLILMCDFNAPKRQGNLGPAVVESKAIKVLIDHHLEPDIECNLKFSYPHMSSTCELVFRLLAGMGYYNDMTLETATCLLTGLITDTQNFTVNIHDTETYIILMKLLEKGVDKNRIVYETMKSISYSALRLNSYAIFKKLEIFPEHRCAVIFLTADELKEYNYKKGDTEGLVNESLRIRGIIYSVFIREDADCIKISMRSRLDFPVSTFCKEIFNGGGHVMAAGAEYYGSIEDCRKLLIDSMPKFDKYLPSKLEKLELK